MLQPQLTVRAIGGPTLVIEIGGLRLITDPTFDAPARYEPRPGVFLEKTMGPSLAADRVGTVDAVLLSHDHHLDNLDIAGREFLRTVPMVLTTVSGAGRLGAGTRQLGNWEMVELPRPDGRALRVTGVPAQHGPDGSEHLVGEVTGFVLSGADVPTVYVSGDNASLDVVRLIRDRLGAMDVAILFAGGAQMPYLPGAFITLSSDMAAEAATILGARRVVPAHLDSWAHFSQGRDTLQQAFREAGLGDLLVMPRPGAQPTAVTL